MAPSDLFHPDLVDQLFFSADWNAYRHHFHVPMFKYLSTIQTDYHGPNVHCPDHILDAVIVDTTSSLVTAEAVRFPAEPCRALSQMNSICINTSIDSKPTLEQKISRSLTDTPSVLESTASAHSLLLGGFRSRTPGGGESTGKLVSSTTVMPLVLVQL